MHIERHSIAGGNVEISNNSLAHLENTKNIHNMQVTYFKFFSVKVGKNIITWNLYSYLFSDTEAES